MDSEIPNVASVAADAPPVPADVPCVTSETIMPIEEFTEQVHTIEHRCFGRMSADQPMVVTTRTGN